LLCTQAVHDELERQGEVILVGVPSKIWLGVPLMIVGKPIGVMVVQHYTDPNAYGEREQHMLEFVSSQVAIAITRKQAEEALKQSQERYHDLFEHSPISLWEEDFSAVKLRLEALQEQGIKGFRLYFQSHPELVDECAALVSNVEVNKAALELFRADRKEVLLANLADILRDESREIFIDQLVNIAQGKVKFSWQGVIRNLAGEQIDVSLTWSAAPGHEDDLSKVIVSLLDITELKRAEEALRNISLVDDLTGLYNRRGFFTLAEQQMKLASRMDRSMLLLYSDLDHLKRINDSLGHPSGDLALIEVAIVFRETFREADILARLGGDEFVVLAIESTEVSASALAARLQATLEAHNQQPGRSYQLSMSLGIARYDPGSPLSVADLITQADRLMYLQKQAKN
jgi:diguanylate cyclase (GGDEF)-like protein/PAS domain S-box-containing protein